MIWYRVVRSRFFSSLHSNVVNGLMRWPRTFWVLSSSLLNPRSTKCEGALRDDDVRSSVCLSLLVYVRLVRRLYENNQREMLGLGTMNVGYCMLYYYDITNPRWRTTANINKKAQLSLTNPRDAKACQNCSNSTCLQRCRWQYWPIFMRLTAIASEIREIPRNSLKIQTYGVQGHPRSSILVSIESPCTTFY